MLVIISEIGTIHGELIDIGIHYIVHRVGARKLLLDIPLAENIFVR